MYTTHLAENRRTYKIYHSRHLQSRLSLFPLLPKKRGRKILCWLQNHQWDNDYGVCTYSNLIKRRENRKEKEKKEKKMGPCRRRPRNDFVMHLLRHGVMWTSSRFDTTNYFKNRWWKKKKNKREKFFACKTESERGNMKWIRNARNSRVNLTANFSWKFSG